MAQFIVTYDLKSTAVPPHPEVIKQAYLHGWNQWIKLGSGQINKLPNTTLVGSFSDIQAAEARFNAIITSASRQLGFMVIVEKYIIMAAPSTISLSDDVR